MGANDFFMTQSTTTTTQEGWGVTASPMTYHPHWNSRHVLVHRLWRDASADTNQGEHRKIHVLKKRWVRGDSVNQISLDKAAPNGRPWAPVLLGKGFRFGFSINQLKNQICDPQCNEDNDNDSQSPCPIGSESGRNRSGRTNKQSLSKKFSVGSVY